MSNRVLFRIDANITGDMPPHIINQARDLVRFLNEGTPDVAPPEMEFVTFEELTAYFMQFEPNTKSVCRNNAERKAGHCWSAITAYRHEAQHLPRYCATCRHRIGARLCVCGQAQQEVFDKQAFLQLRFNDMPLAGRVSRQRLMDYIEHLKTQDATT